MAVARVTLITAVEGEMNRSYCENPNLDNHSEQKITLLDNSDT
jgi:hypothetical protein